jgi:putative acetyltransferase
VTEDLLIRAERPGDEPAISGVISAAFRQAPHASGTEAAIVSNLREAGVLTVSMVAEVRDEIVGHVACSPVEINGRSEGVMGLAPVSVLPAWQGRGVGNLLVRLALAKLASSGAVACVVLGDLEFYGRFGFVRTEGLSYPPAPAEYFGVKRLTEADLPAGVVTYHSAFDV